MNGKIIRLVRDRGFGFIRDDDGKEVFFHSSAVKDGIFDSLSEGGLVEFEMGRDANSNRERAINVRVVVEQGRGIGTAVGTAAMDRS